MKLYVNEYGFNINNEVVDSISKMPVESWKREERELIMRHAATLNASEKAAGVLHHSQMRSSRKFRTKRSESITGVGCHGRW